MEKLAKISQIVIAGCMIAGSLYLLSNDQPRDVRKDVLKLQVQVTGLEIELRGLKEAVSNALHAQKTNEFLP